MKVSLAKGLLLLLMLASLLISCTPVPASWEDATYQKDTVLGDGGTTVTVKVTADEKTVSFTLKTDEENIADAMLAAGLCTGDREAYGLYIKYVNGIRADYELDGGYYWQLNVDGKTAAKGASATPVREGAVYELVRTR